MPNLNQIIASKVFSYIYTPALSEMPRLNKRQAQIQRLANTKRKPGLITRKPTEAKGTRLSDDTADLTSGSLPLETNNYTADLGSELSDETSSVQSSSEDSSNESIIDGPRGQLPETEAITNRQVHDELKWHEGAGKGSGLRSSYSGSSKSTRKRRRRHQRELEKASVNTKYPGPFQETTREKGWRK